MRVSTGNNAAVQRRLQSGRVYIAALLVLCAGPVAATKYSAGGSVRLEGIYDDNIQLVTDDPDAVVGTRLTPSFSAGMATETRTFTVDGSLWFRRFDLQQYNSDDQQMRLGFVQRWEHDQLTLRVQGTRDSTLTSETLDTGRVGDVTRHEEYSASPSWTHTLNERNLVTLSGTYMTSRYGNTRFTGYDYWQAELRWTHILNDRLKLFLVGSHSNYESEARLLPTQILPSSLWQSSATTSIDDGVQIGGEYALSERLIASGLIGRSNNRTSYDVDDPGRYCERFGGFPTFFGLIIPLPGCREDKEGLISTLDSNLTWNTERHQLSANASQQNRPLLRGLYPQIAALSSQLELSPVGARHGVRRSHLWPQPRPG
jgi:hypothetical protein